MPSQVNTRHQSAFRAAAILAAQNAGNDLTPHVMRETLDAEKVFFDNYGSAALIEKTERGQVSERQELPRNRRMITPRTFMYHEIFDIDDAVRLGTASEPNGPMMEAFQRMVGRKLDDLIVEAFDGTAYSGRDGATAVTFPSAQDIAIASTGMTTAKARAAKLLLDNASVDKMDRVMAVHPEQMDDMLADSNNTTSADYNTVRALVMGEIDTWLGFKWVTSVQLTTSAGANQRYAYAFQRKGIVYGTFRGTRVEFDTLPSESHAEQISIYVTASATRQFEDHIVRINCDES